jgi:hypothetical protein
MGRFEVTRQLGPAIALKSDMILPVLIREEKWRLKVGTGHLEILAGIERGIEWPARLPMLQAFLRGGDTRSSS